MQLIDMDDDVVSFHTVRESFIVSVVLGGKLKYGIPRLEKTISLSPPSVPSEMR